MDLQNGGSTMLKLNIMNMKNFLDTVNACKGDVYMLYPEGRKVNIKRQYRVQNQLNEQYRENRNCLRIALEITEPRDYMSIVSYYAGDC